MIFFQKIRKPEQSKKLDMFHPEKLSGPAPSSDGIMNLQVDSPDGVVNVQVQVSGLGPLACSFPAGGLGQRRRGNDDQQIGTN